jgi:hypothetical protein
MCTWSAAFDRVSDIALTCFQKFKESSLDVNSDPFWDLETPRSATTTNTPLIAQHHMV